jgi:hypothetical protein
MGEENTLFPAEFNGSLRIEGRPERLTSEAGAVVLREVLERLGLTKWLCGHLEDPRDPRFITHPLAGLLHTELLLFGQGWRDQDDADALRNDAVMRLAVSTRRGVAPLSTRTEPAAGKQRSKNPAVPDGLASQPTLSRLDRVLSSSSNRNTLRESLLEIAARRIKAQRGGHRMRYLTLDIDSLPVEVHGHQPGSEHNGHYHARIYHPLVASAAETGDLLDLRLREGNKHTADGALSFILELLERVERSLCQVAEVRFDAGFPDETLLTALEQRGTHYVARIKNNPVLDRLAGPYLRRPVGRPPTEPRTWTYEKCYRANSWSRTRRLALVVQERPGEIFLHHFWILTSWSPQERSAEQLLEHYRERGTAEGHMGELMNVFRPALSSSPRQKGHYRGEALEHGYPAGDSFAINEVRLLMNALAYNVMHTARLLLEAATKDGWSLLRFRERVLRVAARVLVHGRRAVMILAENTAAIWRTLWSQLRRLRYAES